MLELAGIVADVLAPVAGVAAIGFLLARRLGIAYGPLSAIAYRVLMPAFVFRILSDPEGAGPVLLMAVTSLLTVIVVWGAAAMLLRSRPKERRTLDAIAATFGNVGNLGFPIVLFGLGEDALAPASIHFLAVTIGVFLLGVTMAARLREGSAWDAAKRVVFTPAIAVTPVALLVASSGWQPPSAVDRFVGLLADAMIPAMLLTLGMQLASARLTRQLGRLGTISILKLVVTPLVFWVMAALVGLEGLARDSGLLLAAMPTAVIVGLVALEFDLEAEVASAAILVTSLAAIPTLAIVLRLLGT